jgi:flavin-dependent dehydrogenase
VLALKGRRVVVLEKEKFPRYHIGESLLPYGYFTLERIGVLDRMKSSHVHPKAQRAIRGRQRTRLGAVLFFTATRSTKPPPPGRCLRSEFDQLLLDNAREKGAEVIEEITVRELIQPTARSRWSQGSYQGWRDARIPRSDHHRRHRAATPSLSLATAGRSAIRC